MMKRILFAASVLLATAILPVAVADSPLTSTTFSENYLDLSIVQAAKEANTITPEIAAFLIDDINPMDEKAAVVNALSWGSDLSPQFVSFLARHHGVPPRRLNEKKLSTDQKALLAYMRSLDNYSQPEKQYELFQLAEREAPKSFTIALLASLNRSQKQFDSSWCAVYKETADTITRKQLTQDKMRKEAIQTVMDYMNLYQSSCYDGD